MSKKRGIKWWEVLVIFLLVLLVAFGSPKSKAEDDRGKFSCLAVMVAEKQNLSNFEQLTQNRGLKSLHSDNLLL